MRVAPTKHPAQIAYEGYAESTGGKTFDGRDMPPFAALPEEIRSAWQSAIIAVDEARARGECDHEADGETPTGEPS